MDLSTPDVDVLTQPHNPLTNACYMYAREIDSQWPLFPFPVVLTQYSGCRGRTDKDLSKDNHFPWKIS